MIGIVSGQPRSGTSLTMQMLQAAGYPIFWDREPNMTTINPRGHYELSDHYRFTPDDLNKFEGKWVKVFPSRWSALTDHDCKLIYLDRDVESMARSQMVMYRAEARGDEILGWRHEDMLRDAAHWRKWALDLIHFFPDHIIIQFKDLFTGIAQEQLGTFLDSTPNQIEKMKACVEQDLRHFRG